MLDRAKANAALIMSTLKATGLWTSIWLLLALLPISCLIWLHLAVRRIGREQAPELFNIIEKS